MQKRTSKTHKFLHICKKKCIFAAKFEGKMKYTDWILQLKQNYSEEEIAYITHRVQSPEIYTEDKYIELATPHALDYDFEHLEPIEYDIPFKPNDKPLFTFIDLFAGIGGIRLGFEDAGGKCIFSSEFDKEACKTYQANFGEYPFGDITKIDANDIPDFDILLGGFPCQAFSIIGKKEGFANETCGTLFFDIERILQVKRPKAFMLENVRNLTAHDNGRTFAIIRKHLEALGYNVYAKVLNALDYGVPQKRERIIIVGFQEDILFAYPDPVHKTLRKTLSSILEENVPSKYYVSEKIRESRLARIKDKDYPRPYISHENMAGSITPHPYSSALRAGASANYILINDERRPTEREMLRIQGFPDNYKIVSSYSVVKHQCGNSVAVPVIEAVASSMINAMYNYNLFHHEH